MVRFNNKRPIIGEWTITFTHGEDYMFNNPGWHWARFGILKLTKEVPEGAIITSDYYNGFLWYWQYFLPFKWGR